MSAHISAPPSSVSLPAAIAQLPSDWVWQIVWFKRDLRVVDHAPLYHASRAGPVLALYVFEPSLQTAPDYADQHGQFAYECLQDLQPALHALNIPLWVVRAEVLPVLQTLYTHWPQLALHSHEETGNGLTFERDRAVARWCRDVGVTWHEYPQHGVVRRLAAQGGRAQWTAHWQARMTAASWPTPQIQQGRAVAKQLLLPSRSALGLDPKEGNPLRQRGGREQGWARFNAFLADHVREYRYGLSSPRTAPRACSRLSPYLAYGALSMREVLQAGWECQAQLRSMPNSPDSKARLAGLRAFESRLHWHCHFMQKLESEPAIEHRNMHPDWVGVREDHLRPDWQAAWAEGATGYPLIDACMQMLRQTGWLNFRMRAMLISFCSYQLWQPWQAPAWHLARCFLDYEPGIHYPQIQMQSGVTGINAVRMYNPIKQAQDHDPDGYFVKRWLPVLRRVPAPYMFQPWLMPSALQDKLGVRIGRDYPAPLVDLTQATRLARARYSAWREQVQRSHSLAVLEKHGSRAGRWTPQQRRPDHPLDDAPRRRASRASSASLSSEQLSFDWQEPIP
ncbi:cryptochrome/deoxyribodipyrimidine photo-lyase family protein [Parvibium lacunae]|uniref:Deoxyribodipyrimidine photolyase n=1 Tax=Parvibium lacunae TaxID=1888893 RepID=A0A368L790_9BURK|nr:FAD-binding domain-containing protein [Parvibium lacunae]RCS59535.1 deoxyribodipyrimidine photolyase [Parvibium lacunae]